MFSLASKLLLTIATPAFVKAYKKGRSIWEAKDELDKLTETIGTIKDVLLDAEKKQDTSVAVENWIKRVRDVLYDVDDLFDEVATDEMLKQQMLKEGKLLKKVRASCSNLNPISRYSIAKKVKAIRKRLLAISSDMAQFNFVIRQLEEPISSTRQGQETCSFVDSKEVVGRDEEKKEILKFLLKDQSTDDVLVTAIVGIGGMGKTTLAQLVYNDEEVQKNFVNSWYACISDTSDDKEVIGKIFQSVCKKSYGDVHLDQLQTEIRKSIKDKKFLLVLDDVWDEDRGRWINRMSLLRSGAKGSKIIVTTRSLSVARAVGALEGQTHNLKGLSENAAWDLFKRVAFTPEKETDPRWANLGREIVKKCARVPLAVRSVGSLLYSKDTIEEWEWFKDNELSKVELSGDSIMQTLKLSYDHLPSNLKPCFSYCSLFPKDHEFKMDELIYLWIAQGYINPIHKEQTVEQEGYSYFMDLHRRSFFQKGEKWDREKKYKMHDLIHDLAQCVAGEEIITLPTQLNKRARHVSIGPEVDTLHLLNTNGLRSLFFLPRSDLQILTYGKYLRALSLSNLRIYTVSISIGELKHLRYLNLSHNPLESLPDSLTNLLNLLALDIGWCVQLKALPDSFTKLINLRHLRIQGCPNLKHMPPGMGKLTCLQKLSDFKVGKVIHGVQRSGLDVLAGLQLRGELAIKFDTGIDNWDGDECWKLPVSLESLSVRHYPGRRIPDWSNHPSLLPNLAHLSLGCCLKVKYLPALRCLPNLKTLRLGFLTELEYIEEEGEEDNGCRTVTTCYINNIALFFPLLEELKMSLLPQLKGWSRRKVETKTASSTRSASPQLFLSFPLLSKLHITHCEELSSFPLYPCVRKLKMKNVDGGVIQQLLSNTSTSTSPSSLQELSIVRWSNHPSLLPNLAYLSLTQCSKVKYLPTLKCLPNLKFLALIKLKELEYIEEEEGEDTFFPVLEELKMWHLPQLKGWWRRKVEATTTSSARSAFPQLLLSFPLLSKLAIIDCEELSSFLLCPCVRRLEIDCVDGGVMQQLLSTASTSTSLSSLEELSTVRWSNHPSFLPNLSVLNLSNCPKLKYLPPLRCLPHLKYLSLDLLKELEYIEEDGEEDNRCTTVAGAGYINNATFFPVLEVLEMSELRQLKGWRRRKVEITTASSSGSASPHLFLSFPLLSTLHIDKCEALSSFPLCPWVRKLKMENVDGGLMKQLLSTTSNSTRTSPSSLEVLFIDHCIGLVSLTAKAFSSLKMCHIDNCHSLENVRLLVSPLLVHLRISKCDGLKSVELEALPSLESLWITNCQQLKSLRIAHLNALRVFNILWCSTELELWGLQKQQEKKCSVDWDSLPNLSEVFIDRLPSPEELPDCLRQLQALGQLQIGQIEENVEELENNSQSENNTESDVEELENNSQRLRMWSNIKRPVQHGKKTIKSILNN